MYQLIGLCMLAYVVKRAVLSNPTLIPHNDAAARGCPHHFEVRHARTPSFIFGRHTNAFCDNRIVFRLLQMPGAAPRGHLGAARARPARYFPADHHVASAPSQEYSASQEESPCEKPPEQAETGAQTTG